ncbi:MAG: T9SS type A sorting domain-containing protein [Bacteroidia bacterium]|nr:T9SS type A sorting domain-containing protein [Bacteroidia bacterium]
MKTLISMLATIIIVCLPKSGFSDPACINGNVSTSAYNYFPYPGSGIITWSTGELSMNNFVVGEHYKIEVIQDAPNLTSPIESMKITPDAPAPYFYIDSEEEFYFQEGSKFQASYLVIPAAQYGQTQIVKFKIYRKVLGLWDWQTTHYHYVNISCQSDLVINQPFGTLAAQDIEVSNNLTVSATAFPNGGVLEFDGGSSVTLAPNFTSDLSGGGYILLINDGCGGAYRLFNPLVNTGNTEQKNISNYKNDNISIYPNPTNDLISIVIPNAKPGEKIKIETRDINGRVLFSEERTHNENSQLDLKDLKPGLYFITISGSDLNYNQKIIKQ